MKIKFPTAQTILLIITAITVLLTWIIPSGKYETLAYTSDSNQFILKGKETSINLKATQHTLDSLAIKIPLEKFTKGEIWKPINIPNTFITVKLKSKDKEIRLAKTKVDVFAADTKY